MKVILEIFCSLRERTAIFIFIFAVAHDLSWRQIFSAMFIFDIYRHKIEFQISQLDSFIPMSLFFIVIRGQRSPRSLYSSSFYVKFIYILLAVFKYIADLLQNCNVRPFLIFQVWYDFEAVSWLITWMCFLRLPIFEYL